MVVQRAELRADLMATKTEVKLAGSTVIYLDILKAHLLDLREDVPKAGQLENLMAVSKVYKTVPKMAVQSVMSMELPRESKWVFYFL
jgi:predicted phosphatase